MINFISENIFNICEQPFHGNGEIGSYAIRRQVTQNDLLGLKDLNTQDPDVQQYILNYLKSCVEAGASGFRFDAAKHVELPDDDEEFASNFWNVVLDNGAEFQYGEILQGDGTDRLADYAEIMNVTTSIYGANIKKAAKGSVSVSSIQSYMANQLDPSKLVTWVESHDNYCNDGSWENFEESEIEYGWAVIAARAGGAPLFFSRTALASAAFCANERWSSSAAGIRCSKTRSASVRKRFVCSSRTDGSVVPASTDRQIRSALP